MRYGVFAATVLAAGLVLATGAEAANGPRIGVVNIQQVIASSHRGQSVKAQLQKVADELNSKIKDRQHKLEVMKQQLDKTSKKSSKYAGLQKAFQKAASNFQTFAYISQQKYNKTKQTALQPVYDELNTVMNAFAADHHFDILLNKDTSGAIYTTDTYNVTAQVTEAMNKDWAEMQAKPADKKGK